MSKLEEEDFSLQPFEESILQKPTKKVLFKWVKHYLPLRSQRSFKSLAYSFESGNILVELLQSLSNQGFADFKKKAKSKTDKLYNLTLAINFCKGRGIPLKIIPEDILKHNEKKIVVVIWKIALFFSVGNLFTHKVDHNSYLLEWCKLVTESYNVKITDFENSFRDGSAFCAIIDAHNDGLIDTSTLNKKKSMENLKKAFEISDLLNIPRLLDTREVSSGKIGKYGILLYISELYKKFANHKEQILIIFKRFNIPEKKTHKILLQQGINLKNKQRKSTNKSESESKSESETESESENEEIKKEKDQGKKTTNNNTLNTILTGSKNEQSDSKNKFSEIVKRYEDKLLAVFVKLREAQLETQKYKEEIEKLKKEKNKEESGDESDPDDPLIKIPKHLRDKERKKLLIMCENQNDDLKQELKDQKEIFEIQLKEKANKITFLTDELEKGKLQSEKELQLEEQLNEMEEAIINLKRKKKTLKEKFLTEEKKTQILESKLKNSGGNEYLDIQNQESVTKLLKEKDQKIQKLTNEIQDNQSFLSESAELSNELKKKILNLEEQLKTKEIQLKEEFVLKKKEYEQNEKGFQKHKDFLEKVIAGQALELEKLRKKKNSINDGEKDKNINILLNNENKNFNKNNVKKMESDYLKIKNEYGTLEIEKNKLLDQNEKLNKDKKEIEEKLKHSEELLNLNKKINLDEIKKLKKDLFNSKRKYELFSDQVNRSKNAKNAELRKLGQAVMDKEKKIQTLRDSILELKGTTTEMLNRSKKRIQVLTQEVESLKTKLNQSKNEKIRLQSTLEDLELKFQKEYESISYIIDELNNNCKNHKKLKKWKGLPELLKFFDCATITYEFERQQQTLRQKENDYKTLSNMLNLRIQEKTDLKNTINILNETEEKMSIELNSLRSRITELKEENEQLKKTNFTRMNSSSNSTFNKISSMGSGNINAGSSYQDLKIQKLQQDILSKEKVIKRLSDLVERNTLLEQIKTESTLDLNTNITIEKLTKQLIDCKMVIQELKRTNTDLFKKSKSNSLGNDEDNFENVFKYKQDREAIIFELDKLDSLVF
ncbi:alpha-actinin [Anaeramoeba flamelloides]|uniref:Alpha-actinin n=1 Tax=Anaeramoeba flamelloides TaxID=1746091 RepID=A0ABQ8Z110_9EUKA|nr:alpha-actinin [Anaeramoeba flamelloides]